MTKGKKNMQPINPATPGQPNPSKRKERQFCFWTFILLAFVFYVQLIQAGIATHDELFNIYHVRLNEYFSQLTWERWGMVLMNALPSYLHALCTSQWTYRLFTMFGLLVACISFACVVKRMSGKDAKWIVLIVFFMMAPIQRDHDGLISFSFSYQLNTCYVFFSLALFYDYLQKREKSKLVVSALLYLMGGMAYETFIPYGFLFFLIDLFYWIDRKEVKVKNIFKDLILHATLVTVYFISYVIVSKLVAIPNTDATVGTGITPVEVIVTTLKLSIGLFPLYYRNLPIPEYLAEATALNYTNLFRWGIVVIAVWAIVQCVRRAGEITGKRYRRISLFCAAGAILPCILPAMTEKFITWIYRNGVKSFGVSYYSYFFIIAWLTTTMIFLYQRIPIKKIFLTFCAVLIGVGGHFTLVSNQVCIDSMHEAQDVYDLFCDLADSDYIKSKEDNIQIYAPDYVGIHYYQFTLSTYASNRSGKNVSVTNKREELDFSRPTYYLKADSTGNMLYYARINEDMLTDECLIYSLDDLDGKGIIADRANGEPPAELTIDGVVQNAYGTDIITGKTMMRGRQAVIRCDNMVASSIETYDTADRYQNGLLKGTGLYGVEDWGRWAERSFAIEVNNTGATGTQKLHLILRVPMDANAEVTMTYNGKNFPFTAVDYIIDEEVEIELGPGTNVFWFESSAPDLEVYGDPRHMNVGIVEMRIGDVRIDRFQE